MSEVENKGKSKEIKPNKTNLLLPQMTILTIQQSSGTIQQVPIGFYW